MCFGSRTQMLHVGILEDCRPTLIAWFFSVGGAGRSRRHAGSGQNFPICSKVQKYEWKGHARKRRTWPLRTRTQWVLFHTKSIFFVWGGARMLRRSVISSMLSRSTRWILQWLFLVSARVSHRQAPTFFCVMSQLKVHIETLEIREVRKSVGAKGTLVGIWFILSVRRKCLNHISLACLTLLRMSSCFLPRGNVAFNMSRR